MTKEELAADEITFGDRKRALAQSLSMDTEEKDEDGQTEADRDIEEGRDETDLDVGRQSYLVLTDEEADEKAAEQIEESLWAFNASFICSEAGLPHEAEEMIQSFQREKCEGANDTIRALIKDFDEFVKAAISADGRGHFLAHYDHNENEEDVTLASGRKVTFYIYRTN